MWMCSWVRESRHTQTKMERGGLHCQPAHTHTEAFLFGNTDAKYSRPCALQQATVLVLVVCSCIRARIIVCLCCVGFNPSLGTFTKSFGSAGGYIAGSKQLVAYLRRHCPAHLYATSMAPGVMQQIISAIKLLQVSSAEELGNTQA